MKILAIRGANLASLAGPFELLLDQGPLAEAGVFAICGPTGSGKSTLLDAMCLALFDTAPRLDGRSRVRVGRDVDDDVRITTSDPRSVLRKGVGAGFAEVDFRGVDGGRYRARWEVRRARDRPEGKLQPTTLSLEVLGTEVRWQGRKTDVKAEIERRLGLSFDQFRRSVLLAQGDFAAFLEAAPKDRADLLERMTGTAIYGAISMEAHARAASERGALERLAAMRDGVELLQDEARAELAERAEMLAIQVRQDELQRSDADRALRWHHELGALAREEREASEEKERIERQLALWEMRRREIEAFDVVRPLRPLHRRCEEAAAAHESRERAQREASEASARAEERREEAVRADARASEVAEAEEGAWDVKRAAIAQARALDLQLIEARPRSEEARSLAEEGARADAEAAAHLKSVAARGLALDERSLGLGQWLAEDTAEPLATEWARTEERLGALVALRGAGLRARRVCVEARAVRDRADREDAAATGRWLGAQRTRLELESTWEAARDAALFEPSDALIEVRERWMSRRTTLETLVGLADKAREAHEAERRHGGRAQEARDAGERAVREAAAAAGAVRAEAARLEELEGQRDRVRAVLDLSARRAELEAGEACPLCGSEEHPYAHETPALDVILADVDVRTREVRAGLSGFEKAAAVAEEEVERWGATRLEARAEAQAWREVLGGAQVAYGEAAQGLGEQGGWALSESASESESVSAVVSTPSAGLSSVPLVLAASGALLSDEAAAALRRARDEAAAKLRELERSERVRRDRERAAEALRVRRDEASGEEARAHRERGAAARRLDTALHEVASARRERDRIEEEQRRLEEALAPALGAWWSDRCAPAVSVRAGGGGLCAVNAGELAGAWPEHFARDPEAFAARVSAAVRARLSCSRDLAAVEAAVQELALEVARARATADAAAERCARAISLRDGAEEKERVLRRAREVALSGDADVVEERFRALLEARLREARDARAALSAAQAVAVRAAAELERAGQELRASAMAAEDARRDLDEGLLRAGLDRDAALAQLARDPEEIAAWRLDLERLDRARSEADAVLTERARKRAAHAEGDAPKLDATAAAEQRARAERTVEITRELLHAARGRLERDDVDLARASRLDGELAEARSQVEVWLTLSDLIGSATGNKLRVFAQSLTLELVLEHANHHLSELAPRYALERVAGEDLALQVVDHGMGDEVRAVGSLSGGESFLVSLGMALGLASLSSERARVDSLFIDEGFGALDASSLETVLSRLDSLQASGRQVGLISHVPMVAERFDTRVEVVAAGPARSRVRLIERQDAPRGQPQPG